MSERQPGGFDGEHMEVLRERWIASNVEVPRSHSREQLFVDLASIAAAIDELHLMQIVGTTIENHQESNLIVVEPRVHVEVNETIQASFTDIAQRCADLIEMTPSERHESMQERQLRYDHMRSVLSEQELGQVQAVDAALDLCEQQQHRRNWIAYMISKSYRKSLGNWQDNQPWSEFFPVAAGESLSEMSESDITPLLEINEIDEVEG